MAKFWAICLFLFSSNKVHAACLVLGCTCGINTISPVAFGNYNPLSASPQTGSGGFSITCTALVALNVSYSIALNQGLNGTFAARKMSLSSSLLSYNLYTANDYMTVWGDGTAGTSVVSDSYSVVLLTRTLPYTVYGRIPISQNIPNGSYSDTIGITLTY